MKCGASPRLDPVERQLLRAGAGTLLVVPIEMVSAKVNKSNGIGEHASAKREGDGGAPRPDLICFSHLRWNFVYQRPQHLLARCARGRRVFFFEEPTFDDGPARLEVVAAEEGRVHVAVPHLPHGVSEAQSALAQRGLLAQMMSQHEIRDHILWYYTPMALSFTRHLASAAPAAIVYDCMDELSAFKGAPRSLKEREAELFGLADVVLTGGQSLYEAKRDQHANIHPLPSSVDVAHFSRARSREAAEPAEQADIPGPRLGFFGVIDERMDIELLAAIALRRPDWHIVLLGPIVKIDPTSLPRLPNIHHLGTRPYAALPDYIAGWDVALLPFARNESTRFISPTKTPEYLAAGRPVVSTSIRDVVTPYGALGFARIADTPVEFIAAVEACLAEEHGARLARVDEFLARMSWDETWARAEALLDSAVSGRRSARSEEGSCSII